MPAPTQPRKRYWLRGGLIGLVTFPLAIFALAGFLFFTMFLPCADVADTDAGCRLLARGPFPLILNVAGAFVVSFNGGFGWALYGVAGFVIGAVIGRAYGRRMHLRAES